MLNIYTTEPRQPAQACIIWLHGLGANGADMQRVVDAAPPIAAQVRHIFVDAPIRPITLNNHMPMQAWYNISGLSFQDREDRDGILQSEQAIRGIVTAQMTAGMQAQQIYLAGFSQGAAMALFVGLRAKQSLGGIIALSGYLPLASDCMGSTHPQLPIFMAMGTVDPIVMPAWTQQSYSFIQSQGYNQVVWKEYVMEHTICMEEIHDIVQWLQVHIQQRLKQGEKT